MSSLGSRLPEDTSYWGDLADRITADAEATLSAYHASRGVWWSGLARGCPALVATAVIAVVAVTLTLSGGVEPATAVPISPFVQAIEPDDALARRFLDEETPPSVDVLLPLMTGAGRTP